MSRLLIFEDSAVLKAPVQNRNRISELGRQLAELISGRTSDDVTVIRAEDALNTLRNRILEAQRQTAVIDFTDGVLSKELGCFDDIPILNLGLSRVKKLDDRLSGQGFLLRGDWNATTYIDLSHPLLLDDVNWSGRSIIEVMNLLKINPQNCLVGNLTTNWGLFGDKKGGGNLLQNMGVTVLSGSNVNTPEDDGFHLEDFCVYSGQSLFQRKLSLDELRTLKQKGMFLDQAGLPKNGSAEFVINPNNLLMPSFKKRVTISDEEAIKAFLSFGERLNREIHIHDELNIETRTELNL